MSSGSPDGDATVIRERHIPEQNHRGTEVCSNASRIVSQKVPSFLEEGKKMFKRRLFLSMILVAIPASADLLQVAVSGQFNGPALSTTLGAEGATWAITFEIDSQPAGIIALAGPDGTGFATSPSSLEYDLNGSAVTETFFNGPSFFLDPSQPSDNKFNKESNLAVFIEDDAGDSVFFDFVGNQLFSGSPSNPEILTGTCDILAGTNAQIEDPDDDDGNETVNIGASSIVITDLSTPEPGAVVLFGTVLLATASRLKRRHRKTAC
jgi:hypothetical protein